MRPARAGRARACAPRPAGCLRILAIGPPARRREPQPDARLARRARGAGLTSHARSHGVAVGCPGQQRGRPQMPYINCRVMEGVLSDDLIVFSLVLSAYSVVPVVGEPVPA